VTSDITDQYMKRQLERSRTYTLVVLRPGPRHGDPGTERIVWEHGRRNFALRADGVLAVVCPVGDDSVSGVGIFDADTTRTREIMDGDPGVRAGVFVYDVHTCRGFPGDTLPD
jgi:hypothetical protein